MRARWRTPRGGAVKQITLASNIRRRANFACAAAGDPCVPMVGLAFGGYETHESTCARTGRSPGSIGLLPQGSIGLLLSRVRSACCLFGVT